MLEQLFQDELCSPVELFLVDKPVFGAISELNGKIRVERVSLLPLVVVQVWSDEEDLSENVDREILFVANGDCLLHIFEGHILLG